MDVLKTAQIISLAGNVNGLKQELYAIHIGIVHAGIHVATITAIANDGMDVQGQDVHMSPEDMFVSQYVMTE